MSIHCLMSTCELSQITQELITVVTAACVKQRSVSINWSATNPRGTLAPEGWQLLSLFATKSMLLGLTAQAQYQLFGQIGSRFNVPQIIFLTSVTGDLLAMLKLAESWGFLAIIGIRWIRERWSTSDLVALQGMTMPLYISVSLGMSTPRTPVRCVANQRGLETRTLNGGAAPASLCSIFPRKTPL